MMWEVQEILPDAHGELNYDGRELNLDKPFELWTEVYIKESTVEYNHRYDFSITSSNWIDANRHYVTDRFSLKDSEVIFNYILDLCHNENHELEIAERFGLYFTWEYDNNFHGMALDHRKYTTQNIIIMTMDVAEHEEAKIYSNFSNATKSLDGRCYVFFHDVDADKVYNNVMSLLGCTTVSLSDIYMTYINVGESVKTALIEYITIMRTL